MPAAQHTFVWPRACVGKGRPRFSRRSGRAYTPAKTVQAEDDLATWVASQWPHAPLEGALRVSIVAEYRPPASWSAKKRAAAIGALRTGRPDPDNLAKLVGDGLNGILWADDAQIGALSITKTYGEHDRTTIIVEAVS